MVKVSAPIVRNITIARASVPAINTPNNRYSNYSYNDSEEDNNNSSYSYDDNNYND